MVELRRRRDRSIWALEEAIGRCRPLLAAGRRALTAEEQQDAYYALQELLAVELPYLYLWHPDIISVKRNTLQGMPEINAATAFQHSEEWYVAR